MALLSACDVPSGYESGICGKLGGGMRPEIEKPAGTLRVVTANMWGIPYWSRDVAARFEAMARRLNEDTSIDVVGLEEMWDGSARSHFLELVSEQYPYRADFHGTYGRSGLVLISRRPFLGDPVFVPYEQTGKWWKPWTGEWWGGKGVGGVRIQADQSDPWVFVTHLHACYAGGATKCETTDEYESIRRSQVATLRAAVNRLAGDEPAIVLGDFNFTSNSVYMKMLVDSGSDQRFDPAWSLVPELQAPRGRIDHVWLRPGLNSRWRDLEPAAPHLVAPVVLADGRNVGLSDHCPIVTVIAPEPGQDSPRLMPASAPAVQPASPTS